MLTGCAGLTTREHRGYVMDEQLTTGIQVGVDNKQSVEKTLGLPSFTGHVRPERLVLCVARHAGLRLPQPQGDGPDRRSTSASTRPGNVAAINQTDEKLIASINPNNDRTPTLGRERSFFDELFNNIGTIRQPGLPGQPGTVIFLQRRAFA